MYVNRYGSLAFDVDVLLLQLHQHALSIDRLEQPRPHRAMHLNRAADDAFADSIDRVVLEHARSEHEAGRHGYGVNRAIDSSGWQFMKPRDARDVEETAIRPS